jgi:hypothetical protein
MNNRLFAQTDQEFREACAKAGIPPSQRQASKWKSCQRGLTVRCKAWEVAQGIDTIDSSAADDNK